MKVSVVYSVGTNPTRITEAIEVRKYYVKSILINK